MPNYEQINNHWWKEWENLSAEQKVLAVATLKQNLSRATQSLPDVLAQHEALGLSQGLLNSIEKLLPFEEFIPLIEEKKQIKLKEWVELYRSQIRLTHEVKRIQAELNQRLEDVNQLTSQLDAQIIAYREIPEASTEKLLTSMTVFSKQVNLLYLKEKIVITRQRLEPRRKSIQNIKLILSRNNDQIGSDQSFDQEIEKRKQEIGQSETQIVRLMQSLQKSAWSSLKSEKEIVYQLSFQEEKLKQLNLQGESLSLDILSAISQLTQNKDSEFDSNWIERQKKIQQELELQNAQLAASRELVLASGEAANQMVYHKTQRSVWQYLEANRKLLVQLQASLNDVSFFLQSYRTFAAVYKGWLHGLGLKWDLLSTEANDGWDKVWNFRLFTINDYPVTLNDFISALLVLIGAILVSRLIKKILNRIGKKRAVSESTLFNVARVIHYLIIAIAILISLSILGIDSTKIALVAGALSVGIGFGLQSIFNNFVSGLILLFERPLKVGDLVELESGVRGRIIAINVRATHLQTRDNIDILVPNSEFVSQRVINYTFADPLRRVHIPFRTRLDVDKELVRTVVIEAARGVQFTQKDKKHAPDLWLKRIGDFGLEFELIVWVNSNKLSDNDAVECQYLWAVQSALIKHRIEIPIPQQDLWINRENASD